MEELQAQLAPLKEQLASYQDLPPVSCELSVAVVCRHLVVVRVGVNISVLSVLFLRIWTWPE